MGPKSRFFLFLFSALFAATTQAQTESSLGGTVTDTTGASVPQATVKLISRGRGTVLTVQTNQAGVYQFSFLQPGVYNLEFTAPGLRRRHASI